MSKKVKVQDLIGPFQLNVVCGEKGLARPILTSDLSRPGLEMAGFFTYYPADRVQLLGRTELTFFDSLAPEEKKERMCLLCDEQTPCIIVTRDLNVPEELVQAANQTQVPVLRSALATTTLGSRLTSFLESKLAPETTMHGVLVDVYGVGILITGGSGIGKSETALELIKRGHRLVADDAVEIRQTDINTLVGQAPELIKHLLEIRGVGIINAMTLFGVGAIRNSKKITMVVRLESWREDFAYDRLGLDEEKIRVIETDLPLVTIPVRPGRNIAVIIEVAAMNYRLKNMGYHAAIQFANKLESLVQEDLEEME